MRGAPRRGGTSRRRLLLLPALAVLLLGGCPSLARALERYAFVANEESADVSVVDARSGAALPAIGVGEGPYGVAITPGGGRVYITNSGAASVSVIDTESLRVIGSIAVGSGPRGIAITPDGSHAYVANTDSESVSVIDTLTNQPVGPPIPVPGKPYGIAISPDGTHAYVSGSGSEGVSVIDLRTNQLLGPAIHVGPFPGAMQISPDGARLYVAYGTSPGDVALIDTQTRQLLGAPIPVGANPFAIAIAPDGGTAYVANAGSESVSLIDTRTAQALGAPIALGAAPFALALTPDGRRLFVATSAGLRLLDTQSRTLLGAAIPIGSGPRGIAIVPDQPPEASLRTKARGLTGTISGEPSDIDLRGSFETYAWSFGDGSSAQTSGSETSHRYRRVGEFPVALTVSDGEGCPGFLFTGQTASCNGASAQSGSGFVATVSAGKLKRNRQRGSAQFTLQLPGAGRLGLHGRGLAFHRLGRASASAQTDFPIRSASAVRILVTAKGGARRRLARTGKLESGVTIHFASSRHCVNQFGKAILLEKRRR